MPVRLSGQDSRRGTFNQRHSVLLDIENEQEYVPLSNIVGDQAHCEIYNSTLSEAGVLGFEYGYSRDYPEALVLWEAQFGDFANVAQAIIDQFIVRGRGQVGFALRAWCCCCRTATKVRGRSTPAPASSAFCNSRRATISRSASPRTPRSIFICCGGRRCARGGNRWWSSRRRACCGIPMRRRRSKNFPAALSAGASGPQVRTPQRILFCTGKIGHELRMERKKRKTTTAIIFVEQLYPFPEAELDAEFERIPMRARSCGCRKNRPTWEPLNYMLPRLRRWPENERCWR